MLQQTSPINLIARHFLPTSSPRFLLHEGETLEDIRSLAGSIPLQCLWKARIESVPEFKFDFNDSNIVVIGEN